LENWSGGCCNTHRSPTWRPTGLYHKGSAMIAFFDLDLNQIATDTKKYLWPRPDDCGRCGHDKVWGHGFVLMIITGFAKALSMRRYRCPKCGCIIRVRPKGHFKHHQTGAAEIRLILAQRLSTGRWPPDCVTNRARHWLKALKRNVLAVFGLEMQNDPLTAFDRLIDLGRIPVSRAV
jgi:hypothetical protein